MGPRPFSRGNAAQSPAASLSRRGFNGAAAFQPRKCLRPDARPGPPSRFNGAAAFQPRKWLFTKGRKMAEMQLQWGRGLSAAEIPYHHTSTTTCNIASMGPRPFSRGNFVDSVNTHTTDPASMGPRPFSRGNGTPRALGCPGRSWLQWGRGLSAAEIPSEMVRRRSPDLLQWGRGLSAAEIAAPGPIRGAACRGFNGAAAFQPRK